MAAQPLVYNQQIIQEPQDIGNYLPTGVCIGPSTNPGSQIPGFSTDASSLTFENALSYGYGNGLLLGPVCTYRIFPAQDVLAITNEILLSTAEPGIIPFVNTNTSSPRSAQYVKRKSGSIFMQMDYPRTVGLYFSTYTEVSTTCSVTAIIRGIDVWGRKVSTSVFLTSAGNPVLMFGDIAPYAQSFSALFQAYEIELTDVNIGDAAPDTAITFVVGNQFGLPFKLTDMGHIQSYSQWWEQIDGAPSSLNGAGGIRANAMPWTEVSNNPATPFYYTNDTVAPTAFSVTPFQLSFPKVVVTGFNGANQNTYDPDPTPPAVYPGVPSVNTADVRGLFSPQDILGYAANPYPIQSANNFNWAGPITISYYVPGADTFIWKYAQMMNQYQQASILDGSVAQGGWDGFGNSFYYNTNANTTNECEPDLELLIGPVPYSDF